MKKHSKIRYTIFFSLLLFSAATVYSQSKISISASVDKSTITIGDLITYTVAVNRDRNVKVQLPSLGENLGGFEIRDYQIYEPRTENGRVIDQFDYTISTFDVGEFEIPPIGVKYSIPPDTTQKVLKTESIKITVESVKPSEEGDIRDVKPPWEIPYNWKRIVLIGFIILAIILVVLGIIYTIRKRRKGEAIIPRKTEPPRPPHEIAYEELQQLSESDLLQKGELKHYYSEISEIIRRYIEGRYQIVALELTTSELMEQIRNIQISEDKAQLFEQFFDLCDLVKFAKYLPGEEENQTVMQRAYRIVDETKWVEPENEEETQVEEAEAVIETESPETAVNTQEEHFSTIESEEQKNQKEEE